MSIYDHEFVTIPTDVFLALFGSTAMFAGEVTPETLEEAHQATGYKIDPVAEAGKVVSFLRSATANGQIDSWQQGSDGGGTVPPATGVGSSDFDPDEVTIPFDMFQGLAGGVVLLGQLHTDGCTEGDDCKFGPQVEALLVQCEMVDSAHTLLRGL